ncbi:MAG TPA: HEAT repeat domain-containing protein [Nitrospira sp.]|nr:HEAT repeat domain-containing protein [Nitrospira sp.]
MTIEVIRQEYVRALLAHPSVATISLFSDAAPVSLDQVYVQRTVLHESKEKQSRAAASSNPMREVVAKLTENLWGPLREHRVVLIEGPAGMGKSTFSKHLVRESLTQEWRLPIWIPFHRFAASQLPLDQYLDQIYVPELGLAGAERVTDLSQSFSLGQWLHGQWRGGLGLLILDGLDEVFDPQERSAALDRLHLQGTGRDRPVTILTTRPYLSQQLPIAVAKTELQPLTPKEQDRVLEGYRSTVQLTDAEFETLKKKVHSPFTNHELLSRPGHLVQILSFYVEYRTLPTTETELLTYLLQCRLQTTGRVQSPLDPDDSGIRQRLLASIAWHLLACRQGQTHTRTQLLTLIQQVLREQASHHTPRFSLSHTSALLDDLVHNSGLLTRVESEGYVPQKSGHYDFTPARYAIESAIWTHLLTGTALADTETVTSLNLTDKQVLEFLDKKAWDLEWEPVLRSWVAQAENRFLLFERLIDKTQDDLARHRLETAARCFGEIPMEYREEAAVSTLCSHIGREVFEQWKAEAPRGIKTLFEAVIKGVWLERDELIELDETLRRVAVRMLGAEREITPEHKHAAYVEPRLPGWQVKAAVVETLGSVEETLAAKGQHALVAKLGDMDQAVREVAVRVLEKVGAALTAESQRALVGWLSDEDKSVRAAAVNVLGHVRAALTEEGQQALMAGLFDVDESVRSAAAQGLVLSGLARRSKGQLALVTLLGDEHWSVRSNAASGLERVWRALALENQEALVAELGNPNQFLRQMAVRVLVEAWDVLTTESQQAFLARLDDPDSSVWGEAVMALEHVDLARKPEIQQVLVTRLTDPDSSIRWWLVQILSRDWEGLTPESQEALVARLADLDGSVRAEVVRSIGPAWNMLKPDGLQAFMARLDDEDVVVRRAAVQTLLGASAGFTPEIQQDLVRRLGDTDDSVPVSATLTLAYVGIALTEESQQVLVARLDDVNEFMRWAAVRVLGPAWKILTAERRQALVARLGDPKKYIRLEAVNALMNVGRAITPEAWQALVARLEDDDKDVREAAALALEQVGAALARSIQQALVARLKVTGESVRKEAMIRALGEGWGVLEAAGWKALLSNLVDADRSVRVSTLSGLMDIGRAFKPAGWSTIVAKLDDPDESKLWTGVESLLQFRATFTAAGEQALVASLADYSGGTEPMRELGRAWGKLTVAGRQAFLARLEAANQYVHNAAVDGISETWGISTPESRQELAAGLEHPHQVVREAAVHAIRAAKKQGLRWFEDGTTMGHGRLVSELSQTDQFADGCCMRHSLHGSFILGPTNT